MDNKQFEIINKKLDTLIKVTGMAACRGLSRDEQTWILYCAGLTSPEIANLLRSNKNAIDQSIHRMKKRVKQKGGSSERSAEASE
jgi:DNA-directed RNA polymerase specialized sigma24 family protein